MEMLETSSIMQVCSVQRTAHCRESVKEHSAASAASASLASPQGAIGSEYKIDASYLPLSKKTKPQVAKWATAWPVASLRSPNVNVASQLEAASTQLQLWILMSSFTVKLCPSPVTKAC